MKTLKMILKKDLIHQIIKSINHWLAIWKNEKVIGLIKNELTRRTVTGFVALKLKTYSYFMGDNHNDKNASRTKEISNKKTT